VNQLPSPASFFLCTGCLRCALACFSISPHHFTQSGITGLASLCLCILCIYSFLPRWECPVIVAIKQSFSTSAVPPDPALGLEPVNQSPLIVSHIQVRLHDNFPPFNNFPLAMPAAVLDVALPSSQEGFRLDILRLSFF